MHGSMTGWHEVRADGSKPRRHYRLFCRLDTEALEVDRPILAVITGMSKPVRTTFSDAPMSAEERERITEPPQVCNSATPVCPPAINPSTSNSTH